jgi:hypothetical protein
MTLLAGIGRQYHRAIERHNVRGIIRSVGLFRPGEIRLFRRHRIRLTDLTRWGRREPPGDGKTSLAGSSVEDTSLRVHIAGLRRTIGVSGRGPEPSDRCLWTLHRRVQHSRSARDRTSSSGGWYADLAFVSQFARANAIGAHRGSIVCGMQTRHAISRFRCNPSSSNLKF